MGESKPETEPHSEFAWTQILVVSAFPDWCEGRHCLEFKIQSLDGKFIHVSYFDNSGLN